MCTVKGPIMFFISSFLFAVMAVFVKLGARYVMVNEIAMVRFLMGIIIALLLARAGKVNLASTRKSLMVARGVFGGLAILLYFAAIKTGSMTHATLLNNTYPVFATVIAAVYLKERVKPSVVLPLAVSIVGIVLLTQPAVTPLRAGDLFALASAVLAGFSVVIIRELRKSESAWSVFFYLSIFGALFSGVLAAPQLVLPGVWGTVCIILAGAFGTAGQVLNTSAYKYCTASVGSALSISTAVFSAILGLVFLGDRLTPVEITGAVMALAGSACIAYSQSGQKGFRELTAASEGYKTGRLPDNQKSGAARTRSSV